MLNIGILGCGDFLRWNAPDIKKSTQVRVAKVFDPDQARAAKFAADLGAQVASSESEIIGAKGIDAVCLFTPPWLRTAQIVAAAQAGQHILATKPLAPNATDCAKAVAAVEKAKVRCGVIYRRTGTPHIAALKALFDGGSIGRLALYRQDWIHHYPQWNSWATDPEKNGGPFMDAMVHNLNIARFLMGRPASHCTWYGAKLAHPELKCNDTEAMTLEFAGGVAHLWMTWAGDLEVKSKAGNDREHIDHCYMVTDQGWYVTFGWGKDGPEITAKKESEVRHIPAPAPAQTLFDRFANSVETGGPLPIELPSIQEAAIDITLLRGIERSGGQRLALDASMGGAAAARA